MASMLENIKCIGMFMIVAQTVLHFAAGKQYEKYMKAITGVIILSMFIGPFLSGSEVFAVDWQTEYERIEKQIQMQNSTWQEVSYEAGLVETTALQGIQEEIRSRFNELAAESGIRVTSVVIDLEQMDGNTGAQTEKRDFAFRRVKVTIQDTSDNSADSYSDGMIRIEEIMVGQEAGANESQETEDVSEQGNNIKEYQHLFAQTLGIADDRVEVIYLGRR